jgi:hypothetical protein
MKARLQSDASGGTALDQTAEANRNSDTKFLQTSFRAEDNGGFHKI